MKLLLLFTFSALFGSTVSFANCFKEKSLACNQKLQNGIELESDFTFCGFQKKVINCLITPAIECNMKFKSLAQNFNSVIKKVCKRESDLYKELEKNRGCITKGLIDTKCIKAIVNIIKNGNTPKNILKSQKEACRQLDKIAECTIGNVKHYCGGEVMAFRFLYNSAIELHKGICEEIIMTENEDDFTTKRSEKTMLPPFFGPLEFIV
ncbi:uncharacterized protein NPIL_226261 [Nephila pilipes]|uniref:DUF19 domain-containing protein n=1 Tax=Nephila pilipes TaxID=299642 RepID=A0A8X6QS53_NEPPI|nr:uncharacterized protein NPIL_226261 [Nephila pilipes]